MIPEQVLAGRRGEPLPFLSWVEPLQIPLLRCRAYPCTATQMIRTFYFLTGSYGLWIDEPDLETFETNAMRPGNLLIRVPVAFFKGKEQRYLAFDWLAWLRASGYLIAVEGVA